MVQSEAQKRAKAKYYSKLREDPQYREEMAQRQQEYFDKNKEQHLETVKTCYQANKKRFMQISKRKEDKIKLILWFLSWKNMSTEELAKIFLEARKTKLLEIKKIFRFKILDLECWTGPRPATTAILLPQVAAAAGAGRIPPGRDGRPPEAHIRRRRRRGAAGPFLPASPGPAFCTTPLP
jgi:hypothetical protein